MCKLSPAVNVCGFVFTGNVRKHTQIPPAWKCDREGVHEGGHNCRFSDAPEENSLRWHFTLLHVSVLVGSARQNISAPLLVVVKAALLHLIVALSQCLYSAHRLIDCIHVWVGGGSGRGEGGGDS